MCVHVNFCSLTSDRPAGFMILCKSVLAVCVFCKNDALVNDHTTEKYVGPRLQASAKSFPLFHASGSSRPEVIIRLA